MTQRIVLGTLLAALGIVAFPHWILISNYVSPVPHSETLDLGRHFLLRDASEIGVVDYSRMLRELALLLLVAAVIWSAAWFPKRSPGTPPANT